MIHNIQINQSDPKLTIPPIAMLQEVADYTLCQMKGIAQPLELSISLVDEIEMQQLNHQFRNNDKPTNVLAFPCDMPCDTFNTVLGDIILCAPVINTEAEVQHKTLAAHWSHLMIHGTLHLLGFDHQTTMEAYNMEQREIQLLAHWDHPNPYELTVTNEVIDHE